MKLSAASAVLAVVALLVAAMQQAAGAFGVIVVCTMGWAVALVALRSRVPRAHFPRPRPNHRPPPATSWPALRDVDRRLWWASRSPRLYDHAARPLVSRVTAVLLGHQAGVHLAEEPQRAQAFLGDDVWRLVDPRHVPSEDNNPPGVSPEALDRLLTRLEEL